MSIMTVAAPAKLPFWCTVGQAYKAWVINFPELLRVSWPWMLLMTPVLGLLDWWVEQPGADLLSPLLTTALNAVSWVVMVPALAAVAVAWHRRLLIGEHPGRGVYGSTASLPAMRSWHLGSRWSDKRHYIWPQRLSCTQVACG
jgi:hypothetical protein